MKHDYKNPVHSVFTFGQTIAEVVFGGDVNDSKAADIEWWRFTRHGEVTTPDWEAMDECLIGKGGFADVFRELHCPFAARYLEARGLKVSDIVPGMFD